LIDPHDLDQVLRVREQAQQERVKTRQIGGGREG
jgi:hypothetical protein